MSNISITHSHPCQKQPFGDVLRKKCSEIMQHIYRRTRIYNVLIFWEVYFYHGGCFRGFFKLEATTSQTDDFKINFKALLTPDISVIILIQCFKSYIKKSINLDLFWYLSERNSNFFQPVLTCSNQGRCIRLLLIILVQINNGDTRRMVELCWKITIKNRTTAMSSF